MTTLDLTPADQLRHDFSRARAHLAHARRHQAAKDTPANRAAVARCLTVIDTVLDMYLDVGPRSATTGPRRAPGAG